MRPPLQPFGPVQIYLFQNDQQTGPYTEQQICDLLAAGSLQSTDVCWHEGLSDWQPLQSVISFRSSGPEIPNISLSAPSQPAPTVVQTNVRQGALIGGIVCFVIAIVVMFSSMWLFFIYGPLFLVSFVLSVVALAQKRILGGILLLLATLIVPSVLGLYLFLTRTTEALAASAGPSVTASTETAVQPAATALPPNSPVASAGDVTSQFSPPSTPEGEPTPTELPSAKNAELDAKKGFRNYKLGTPIGDFNPNDLEAGRAFVETDAKPYFVKNFDPKLGAAEIEAIQLSFNEGLLERVIVRVQGEQNALALRETLIVGYGQPITNRSFMSETTRWEGDDCTLSLNNELMGGASAHFSSKSVDQTIKETKLKKAKEEAATGAGAL